MKQSSNLKEFQLRLIKNVKIFYLAGIVLFSIIFTALFLINQSIDHQEFEAKLKNANTLLQYDLATQLTIIFNDPTFVSFIRSGEISREKYRSNINWIFSNINHRLIAGIKISDLNNNSLYTNGGVSELFTKIQLCYLDSIIEQKLGLCKFNAIIYFNKNVYLSRLNFFEKDVQLIKNSNFIAYNPMQNNFGLYNVNSKSNIKIDVGYNVKPPYMLFVIAGLTYILFTAIFIYAYKYTSKQVTSTLVKPLREIMKCLKSTNSHLNYNPQLEELKLLMTAVEDRNSMLMDSKLNEIAEAMVHDLRGPINGIRIALPKILNKDNKRYVDFIDNYLNKIFMASKIVLEKFRNRNDLNLHSDNGAVYKNIFSMKKLIFEILNSDEKWLSDNIEVKQKISDDILLMYPRLDIYNKISNLLNNAYESLTNDKKIIEISTTQDDAYCAIEIKDTGCGMDTKKILASKKIESTKHIGAGIGLSSAIQYVQQAGGVFEIDSIINLGTRIHIRLPNILPKFITNTVFLNGTQNIFLLSDNSSSIAIFEEKMIGLPNKLKLALTVERLIEALKTDNNELPVILISGEFFDSIRTISFNNTVNLVIKNDFNILALHSEGNLKYNIILEERLDTLTIITENSLL